MSIYDKNMQEGHNLENKIVRTEGFFLINAALVITTVAVTKLC